MKQPSISVSDLAVATGIHDTTVSQALRHLRATQVVTTQRDGRVVRYLLTERPVCALLAQYQSACQPHPS